jgi:hypothetical protein
VGMKARPASNIAVKGGLLLGFSFKRSLGAKARRLDFGTLGSHVNSVESLVDFCTPVPSSRRIYYYSIRLVLIVAYIYMMYLDTKNMCLDSSISMTPNIGAGSIITAL